VSIIESALGKIRPDTLPDSSNAVRAERGALAEGYGPVAKLQGRPVVEIDRENLRAVGMLPPQSDERRLMSQYRAIKRKLLARLVAVQGQAARTGHKIMITSAMASEGKTFTSFNLAQSLAAERDWVIVLVDADVTRQTLTRNLGLGDRPGLLDALSNQGQSIRDSTYQLLGENLFFVPAGTRRDDATELMASNRMASIANELTRVGSRTLILFDSSPIVLTPEAQALADAVDRIVLVVKADETLRRDVASAVKLLGERHQVDVILNQFRRRQSNADYYGGYEANLEAAQN